MISIRNPFRPGFGRTPPNLAGREQNQSELADDLSSLLSYNSALHGDDEYRPPGTLVISAPRGMGKTVLLKWLRTQAAKSNDVDVVRMDSSDIRNMAQLAQKLVPDAVEKAGKSGWNVNVGAGIEHLASGTVGVGQVPGEAIAPPHWKAMLYDNLTRRERPLLVTLDEAHCLKEEVVPELANLLQSLEEEDCPVWFLLAGTPGVLDHLSSCGAVIRRDTGDKDTASFFGRAEYRTIELLDRESAKSALVKPLLDQGWTVEAAALDKVLEAVQGYPYFIQVWGKEIWDVGIHDGKHLSARVVDAALPAVGERCTNLYSQRVQELYTTHGDVDAKQSLRAAAVVAARVLEAESKVVPKYQVESVLSDMGLSDHQRDTLARAFLHSGFMVKTLVDNGEYWQSGIPSLATHIVNEADKRGLLQV